MTTEDSPWALARAAALRAGVRLDPLESLEEADQVRGVIDQVWGEQVLPREVLRAFEHAGGLLWGARAGDRLVGFVLGFGGVGGGLHLHSHMLAVLPEFRSQGTGHALKLAQRAACLEAGIGEVRWTYDPLVARNARFNLVGLGAEAVAFLPAFYGEMIDRLNRGDRSDRFEVRWRLWSDRAVLAAAGEAAEPDEGPAMLEAVGEGEDARPKETGAPPEPGARVAVPADHLSLRRRDPSLGAEWRDATARAFGACFDAGLVALWMTRDRCYVFGSRPAPGEGR
jgi:predicted GNAT superfamily acetyltransferase